MLLRRHRPDNTALSALLDGQLSGHQLAVLEAHLASCAACCERLAALRRTRDALRALPQADAPRSFRLRAADVAAPAPRRRAPAVVRAMPLLGAAAVLVFVAVLEADLARGGSPGNNEATGPQAMSAATHGATTAAGGGIGQIGAADNASAPASAAAARSNATPSLSSPVPGSEPGGAGAPPAPEGATPGAASGGASGAPAPGGSPRPAFGAAPGPATPPGERSAPDAPAPAVPPTQPASAPAAKSAATLPASTPAGAQAAAAAPTSSHEASPSSAGGLNHRSDVSYRIVEAVAAATALTAVAGSVAWRIRNRKVGP